MDSKELSPLSPEDLQKFIAYTLVMCKKQRERPLFTTVSQVFILDVRTQSNWLELSSRPVPVHLFYDNTRRIYRIISVEGSKPVLNGSITSSLMMSKASSKFLQLLDQRTNTVHGLGFTDDREMVKFMTRLTELKSVLREGDEKEKNDPLPLPKNLLSEDQSLRIENERLKGALAESSVNAKNWELELNTLKEVNKKLTDALTQSKTKPMDQTVPEIDDATANLLLEKLKHVLTERSSENLANDVPATEILEQIEGLIIENRTLHGQVSSLNSNSLVVRCLFDQMGAKLQELLQIHKQIALKLHANPVEK